MRQTTSTAAQVVADQQAKLMMESPLGLIVSEMIRSHNSGLYYAAVTIALTLPDICSALEKEAGHERMRRNQERYEAWCQAYVGAKFQLTAQDLWALRGGVIHNGQTFGHPKAQFQRVAFILPDGQQNSYQIHTIHGENSKPVMSIDVSTFCQGMKEAAIAWTVATRTDELVQRNLQDLVRLRPNGFPPHVVGIPMIT